MSKVIFLTGASRGFGKIWAKALLQRGDRVAVTARHPEDLNDLISEFGDSVFPIKLNVDDRNACFEAVALTKKHFGTIDILVNNAGFGLFGAIEETTEVQARAQIETNFFGLLWITQAILPIMREQKSGHIVQVSSVLGLITAPALGLYNASKHAVIGLSETLAAEVAAFGIKVSIIEPNGFSTDWSSASSVHTEPNEIYEPLRKEVANSILPEFWGRPENTVSAFLNLLDSANPPLHFLLGKIAYPAIKEVYERRVSEFEEWNDTAVAAHGF